MGTTEERWGEVKRRNKISCGISEGVIGYGYMRKKQKKTPMEMVREKRPDLYDGILSLLEHGEILLEAAMWDNKRVEEWVKRSEKLLDKGMDWDKTEEMRKEGEKLYKRLEIAKKELNKMNVKYDELREEIRKEFGEDILPDNNNKKETPPKDDEGGGEQKF